MNAGRWDFEVEEGSPFVRVLTLYGANDVVVNLTGRSATMQIRTEKTSSTILLELSTANGKLSINGPAGQVTLTISDTDATLLMTAIRVRPRQLIYDLKLTPSIGRLLEVEITMDPAVTR